MVFLVETNATLEKFGVNFGRSRKPSPQQLLAKTKTFVDNFFSLSSLFNLGPNCIYSDNDYQKLMVYTAINNNYLEGSSKQWKLEYENSGPTGESIFHHIKKKTSNELNIYYDSITEEIIKRAKKNGGIGKNVIVSIDITNELYYGYKDDPMVVPTQPQRGTSHAYKYATINIVDGGQRYTLKTIAVDPNTPTHEIVSGLILFAKRLVNIKLVLMDRGFLSKNVASTLNKLDCKYIIPAVNNKKVERLLRIHDAMKSVRYEIGSGSDSTWTNLVIVIDKKGEKRGFITNIEGSRIIHQISAYYSKRWGIETSYRMIKQFRAKTTSKNPIVRLFHFLFGVFLYNMWQLVNINAPITQGRTTAKYELPALIFGHSFLRAIRMMGTGPPQSRNTQSLGTSAIMAG